MIKIGYDKWEKSHPFWSYPSYILNRIENDDLYNKLASYFCSTEQHEKRYLDYILYSLSSNQEYDAGNAIICAIQENLISYNSVLSIAEILVRGEIKFESKIGQILLSDISMLVGMILYEKGEEEIGKETLKLGLDATKKAKYGKQELIKKWLTINEDFKNIPSDIKSIIDALE